MGKKSSGTISHSGKKKNRGKEKREEKREFPWKNPHNTLLKDTIDQKVPKSDTFDQKVPKSDTFDH